MVDFTPLDDAVRAAYAAVDEATTDLLRAAGLRVVASTMRRMNGLDGHPKRIDTGRLRGGWGATLADLGGSATEAGASEDGHIALSPRELEVWNDVEYAAYVEFGTSKMAPGWHLHGAVAAEAPVLDAELADLVDRAMEAAL